MAEQETPYFFKGHNFDLREFRRDLYRLLCYFEASEPIAAGISERNFGDIGIREDFLENLQKEFFTDEVSRVMLQTAICVRILQDESEVDTAESSPRYCGVFQYPCESAEQPLTLREACNKLVHAKKVNYDVVDLGVAVPAEAVSWVQPRVYLYGTLQGTEWKATIDVAAFVLESAKLFQFRTLAEFIEHRRASE